MKIRITGAQKETFWYADKVGQIFETDGHICSYAGYRICGKTPSGNEGYVQLKDCVIVPDEAGAGITLLPDESLGGATSGVLREYHEVKRKADAGETVIMTEATGVRTEGGHEVPDYRNGDIFVIDHISGGLAGSTSGKLFYHREYSVLEPTEILVINSERYTMVDRKATVGDRVIVVSTRRTEKVGCVVMHEVGETGSVTERLKDRVYVSGWYVLDEDVRVLEPVEPADATPEPALLPDQATRVLSDLPAESQAAANIVSLALRLTQAEAKITALESVIGALTERKVAAGPVDKSERAALPSFAYTMYCKAAAISAKTPQMVRDEIVEHAKADVRRLEASYGRRVCGSGVSFWPDACAKDGYGPVHDVEYVVNAQKRTVVALIRYKYGELQYRGIAKCAPGETFNAHIGRAISLRRALGLTVPAEYLNAPGPTEVRVGDVVIGKSASFTIVNDIVSDRDKLSLKFANTLLGGTLRITDDSREDGGNSAASSALKGAA